MSASSVSISTECINLIRTLIVPGATIFEFGSGEGTVRLSEHFTLYSVENQYEWMDRYPKATTYINCRTKSYDSEFTAPDMVGPQTAWYHPEDVLRQIPRHYDLILIDGPGGHYGRGGFLKLIDKFNTKVPIVFDDINRPAEFDLMVKVSEYIGRPYHVLESDKSTGYING